MAGFLKRFASDKWLKYLTGLSAYFFLLLILLHTQGRVIDPAFWLFMLSVTLLLVRAVCLAAGKGNKADTPSPLHDIIQNATIFIGYLVLLAVILGPGFELSWLIYALAGITAAGYLIAALIRKR